MKSIHGTGRQQGFTLVELMVTMVIIGILATVAVLSTRGSKYEREMSRFAAAAINAFKEARSRAISTGRKYVVQFTNRSVQWCECGCPPARPASTCLPAGEPHKYGKRYWAREDGAEAFQYATVADFNLSAYPSDKITALGTNIVELYFLPNGTADSDITNTTPDGFTVYLKHAERDSLKWRIVVLPLSGSIRKYTTWAD